jgi:hypothetical protein
MGEKGANQIRRQVHYREPVDGFDQLFNSAARHSPLGRLDARSGCEAQFVFDEPIRHSPELNASQSDLIKYVRALPSWRPNLALVLWKTESTRLLLSDSFQAHQAERRYPQSYSLACWPHEETVSPQVVFSANWGPSSVRTAECEWVPNRRNPGLFGANSYYVRITSGVITPSRDKTAVAVQGIRRNAEVVSHGI